ncbi:MAG: hypothetical protein M1827_006985 [Pycnora praestabilis]|nr:MAG: hypothetical protein M1827_006985 [Pycnora praestabilis]
MVQVKARKRKSSFSASSSVVDTFTQPTMVAIEPDSPTRTPSRSPSKRRMLITYRQKQALIDNLQLEITERARKLRAQYTLQSQGLRNRIELRVNRIPMALRKATMGEIMVRFARPLNANQSVISPVLAPAESSIPTALSAALPVTSNSAKDLKQQEQISPARLRGTKRPSDDMVSADKENENMDLSLHKKRSKPTAPIAAANSATSRAKFQPSQVLSPKSSNSRTLPQSPIRSVPSSLKTFLARPVSSVKPAAAPVAVTATLASMVEKPRPTRAAGRKITPATNTAAPPAGATAGRGKRGAQQPPKTTQENSGRGRAASNSSEMSNSTAGTTVVRKGKKAPTVKKGTVASKIAGINAAGKKLAAAAAAKADAPSTGRRVLRKRN